MTGVSLELSGMAAVQKTAKGASSIELTGKAAVESDDGRSLEIIGKAGVKNNTGSLEIIGKAAVQNSDGNVSGEHMIHFSWKNACLVCMAFAAVCALMFVRFVYLWQQCLMTRGASSWLVVRASVVLGTEIGLFVMSVLLVLLVPRMIITWTTTLVVKYMVGVVVSGKIGRKQIVKEGTKVAKELSWITLTGVFEEGNAAAAAVLVVCFSTTVVLRQLLTVG